MLCLLLGMAALFSLRFGFKAAFFGLEPGFLFRFIRYAFIGLAVALGAPWLFMRLRLVKNYSTGGTS